MKPFTSANRRGATLPQVGIDPATRGSHRHVPQMKGILHSNPFPPNLLRLFAPDHGQLCTIGLSREQCPIPVPEHDLSPYKVTEDATEDAVDEDGGIPTLPTLATITGLYDGAPISHSLTPYLSCTIVRGNNPKGSSKLTTTRLQRQSINRCCISMTYLESFAHGLVLYSVPLPSTAYTLQPSFSVDPALYPPRTKPYQPLCCTCHNRLPDASVPS